MNAYRTHQLQPSTGVPMISSLMDMWGTAADLHQSYLEWWSSEPKIQLLYQNTVFDVKRKLSEANQEQSIHARDLSPYALECVAVKLLSSCSHVIRSPL
ncbi:hypothetical protein SUGI_0417800 [Cryptomeria japonica]|nr:hypothetical protein SUGI_0417800 [Cryptomeria japonica]